MNFDAAIKPEIETKGDAGIKDLGDTWVRAFVAKR